jgi:hypothetical protein
MYGDEDAKCQLCKVKPETLEHVLLDCTELSNIRNPIAILRQIERDISGGDTIML